MSPSSTCDLCVAQVQTTRYYEDEECWIADCLICHVPMVVWRVHDPAPPREVRIRLHERLAVVADEFWGERPWRYDDVMRKIPDHYHAHARRG